MRSKLITVFAGDGRTAQATMPICECGERLWEIFQLEGFTHFHLQCHACGTNHCPGGCEKDPPLVRMMALAQTIRFNAGADVHVRQSIDAEAEELAKLVIETFEVKGEQDDR